MTIWAFIQTGIIFFKFWVLLQLDFRHIHILNVIPGIPAGACFFKRKVIIIKYNI